ncbi:hypothetical protein A2686_00765 [Candidatus Woesebacteria bacterium RIFCSPHIGHO2_01_FULL_38_10]|uniref:Glycosyltransferase 2-like domain-containing protein n=1 Tax=Candidatus Woesebacteria bacterium RIFCSPLOWO2_01_FULL_39_10b TaxID=1802517 RepID=A0A1F8BBB3_9BACT|nr:MAG: hypothetical protein A2686_00765 [Candidatus Woesebacteria bacterium RIFCSPHIGHO2_01_FULL_38_10]OGM60638.1 MAG: hypothetical protein A2892_01160 [Candidatus Woesebacteria bacterium RIFCSPLOWO2_01_FULL_39_10b]
MGKISVVVNTLNEEKNLTRALASVKNFADEIVICDAHSDIRRLNNQFFTVFENNEVKIFKAEI